MPTDDAQPVPFVVVDADELREYRRPRRDWSAVLEQLRKGKTLFLTDAVLDDNSLKYLSMHLSRTGSGHLRSKRMAHGRRRGRKIWAADIPREMPPFTTLREEVSA